MPRFTGGADYDNRQKEGGSKGGGRTVLPHQTTAAAQLATSRGCWWWRYQGRINHSLSAGGSTSTGDKAR